MTVPWSGWSWSAAVPFAALACVAGSLLADGFTGAVLLGGGIAFATIGIAWHVVGTWRVAHSH